MNYREYLFKYGESPEHLKFKPNRQFEVLFKTIMKEAKSVTELIDRLEEGEEGVDVVALLKEGLRLSYGDLIERLKESIKRDKLEIPKVTVSEDRHIKMSELIEVSE